MGRKLPWKREEPEPKLERRGVRSSHILIPAHREASSSPAQKKVKTHYDPTNSSSHGHNPSTSPLLEAPAEEFMRDGFDADDVYRMVEDEFFVTAQRFTVHLHRAEYERLKTLARDRHAAAICDLSRPTADAMSDLARLRTADEVQAYHGDNVENYNHKDDDNDDDDDDDDMTRKSLQALMDNPRRARRSALGGITKTGITGTLKASNGLLRPGGWGSDNRLHDRYYGRVGMTDAEYSDGVQQRNDKIEGDDNDDEDGLDAPVRRRVDECDATPSPSRDERPPIPLLNRRTPVPPTERAGPSHAISAAPVVSGIDPSNDDDLFARLRERRKAATARSRQLGPRNGGLRQKEDEAEELRLTTMPTFL